MLITTTRADFNFCWFVQVDNDKFLITTGKHR